MTLMRLTRAYLAAARARLHVEREVAAARDAGATWADIAGATDTTPVDAKDTWGHLDRVQLKPRGDR